MVDRIGVFSMIHVWMTHIGEEERALPSLPLSSLPYHAYRITSLFTAPPLPYNEGKSCIRLMCVRVGVSSRM